MKKIIPPIIAFFISLYLLCVVHAETNPEFVIYITSETEKDEADYKKTAPQCEALDMYLSRDEQNYIYSLAQKRYTGDELKQYYAYLIGIADAESSFKANVIHYNKKNDSVDRGMFQINSVNVPKLKRLGLINTSNDLFNSYVSADCGDYQFSSCFSAAGYSEDAYSRYFWGYAHAPSIYSKRAWDIVQKWYSLIWSE